MTVAHIRMPENGVFVCRVPATMTVSAGTFCIVELDYGLDVGMVLDVFDQNGQGDGEKKAPSFRVVRSQEPNDEAHLQENKALSDKAQQSFLFSICHEKNHVKLLHVRLSYGRERLFIRYSAQVPVDLRRFVGQLQRDFKTHVDLWQVGVRDEAAFVGCVGPCGRAVCCCTWQHQFPAVNVRMAKAQEMSLNPVSLNGSCGRLKCCLRFEYDQYCTAGESMPESGRLVICHNPEKQEGVVVSRDVMRGKLTLRTAEGRFITVPVNNVEHSRSELGCHSQVSDREVQNEDPGGEWSES